MKKKVLQGIDRIDLMDNILKGKRLGVVSSGGVMNRKLQHSVDVLMERYRVTALFNTVMGIRGEYIYGEEVSEYIDSISGMKVKSIFNPHILAPTTEMLEDVDIVVFDQREAGVRFFEYLHCCAAILKACAANNKPMVVLDRVNPLGGKKIEGTVCPETMHSIVGDYQLATRTALTMGEFITYVNQAYHVGCDLTVIPLQGWQRNLYFDDTDLTWLLPSPSLPNTNANLLYAGLCILEGVTTLSEGRGTSMPFELVGAPWIDSQELVGRLRKANLSGIDFAPVYFKPTASKYAKEVCKGVQLIIKSREDFESFHTAVTLFDIIRNMYPEKIAYAGSNIGHDVYKQASEPHYSRYIDLLLANSDYASGTITGEQLIQQYASERALYQQRTLPYHLYD